MADFQRKTAVKIKIEDLKQGEFVKSSGNFDPSFVKFENQEIGRVNIIGVVIEVTDLKDSLSVDDGTDIINVRSFNNDIDLDFDVGTLINVIGKPREFNNDIFVTCEIVKKISNPTWFKLRKKELALASFIQK